MLQRKRKRQEIWVTIVKLCCIYSLDNITPLETSVNQLSEGLTAIINEQAYMKMRERVHRNSNFIF